MPLPLWNNQILKKIIKLVDDIIAKKDKYEELDNYIINQFSFTEKEKKHIKNFNIK
jgi:deoxyhypusine synthase